MQKDQLLWRYPRGLWVRLLVKWISREYHSPPVTHWFAKLGAFHEFHLMATYYDIHAAFGTSTWPNSFERNWRSLFFFLTYHIIILFASDNGTLLFQINCNNYSVRYSNINFLSFSRFHSYAIFNTTRRG